MATNPTILILFKALGTGAVAASFGALKLAATGMSKALGAAGAGIAGGARGFAAITEAAFRAAGAVASMAVGGARGLISLGSSAVDVAQKLAGIGIRAAAVGAALAGALVVKSFNADNITSGVQNTLTAVYGNAQQAREELGRLGPTLDGLGLSISKIAPLYAQFQAGASGTALAGEGARKVFLQVAEASKTLGLGVDQQQRVFTALGQVLGKGKLQAEELRQQLGESLPGAFQIAARAMGVTTAELNKMLEAGQVMADDFLPKFGDQIQKEFGNVKGAVDRPASAFERLKNVIFEAFTVIARSGLSDLTVRGMNRIRTAIRALIDDGDIAMWTRTAVAGLDRMGRSLLGVGRTAGNVLTNLRLLGRGGLIASAVTDAGALEYGFKTAGRMQAALNDRTARGIAQRILEARSYAAAIARSLVPAFRDAQRAAGQFAGFIGRELPGVIRFLTGTAIPGATSALQTLYNFLARAGTYVRQFVDAFSRIQNGLGFQIRFLLGQLGLLKGSITGAFAVSPDDLALGITNGVYRVNTAILALRQGFASAKENVGEFIDGLTARGTFEKMRSDLSAVVKEISGLIITPEALKSPDALAAAFDAAYRKISEKTAATYNYMKDAGSAFIRGVTFDPKKQPDQQEGNNGQALDPEFAVYADIGRAVRSIADLFIDLGTNVLPIVIDHVKEMAGPIAEAANNVFKLINGFRQLVGDDAFAKILTLVLGLGLLSKLGLGGVVGGAAAGASVGLGAAFAAAIRTALPAVLIGLGIGTGIAKAGEAAFNTMRPDAQKRVEAAMAPGRQAYQEGRYLDALGELPTAFRALAQEDSAFKTRLFNVFSPDGFFDRTFKYAFRTPEERQGARDRNDNFLAASDYYFQYGNSRALEGAFAQGSAVAELARMREISNPTEDAAKAAQAAAEAARSASTYKAPDGMTSWTQPGQGMTSVFQINGGTPSPPMQSRDQAAVEAWTRTLARELNSQTQVF